MQANLTTIQATEPPGRVSKPLFLKQLRPVLVPQEWMGCRKEKSERKQGTGITADLWFKFILLLCPRFGK